MRRLVAATLVTAAFVGGVFAPTSSADPAVGVRAAAKSLVGLSAPTNNAPRGAYSLAHGWRLIATAGSPPANAQWYSDPTQPRINQTIAFTGFASDPDGDIATYAWNWGDGNSTGASANDQATHSYTTAGTYTVRLTVTDATALSTAYENTITIRNNWAPADVYAYPDTTVDTYPRVATSATFDFYGYDPEDYYSGDLAWDVNWGDGTAHSTTTTAGFTQLVHTWTTPGTYIIHYSATDTDGTGGGNPNKTTFGTPLVVTVAANPAPRDVSWSADIYQPAINQTVTFTGYAQDPDGGSIANYQWDFNGDGVYEAQSLDNPINPGTSEITHQFTQPGTFAVGLRVTDNDPGASTTYIYTYTVTNPANGPYGYLYTDFGSGYYGYSAKVNTPIHFYASVYDPNAVVHGTNYVFHWGDGTGDTRRRAPTRSTPIPRRATIGCRSRSRSRTRR